MNDIGKAALLCVVLCPASCDRPVSTAAPQTSTTPLAANAPATEPTAPPSKPSAVASAMPSPPSAPADASSTITFNDDTTGAPSPAFDGVVGDWYVSEEA